MLNEHWMIGWVFPASPRFKSAWWAHINGKPFHCDSLEDGKQKLLQEVELRNLHLTLE